MDNHEIIQSLQAIYNTIDGISVAGIENQAKLVGCASHIRTMLQRLQAEQPAEDAVKKQAEADKAKALAKGASA